MIFSCPQNFSCNPGGYGSKICSLGWQVITINGNDQDEIRAALMKATQEKERPTLIIGKTIMAKVPLTPIAPVLKDKPPHTVCPWVKPALPLKKPLKTCREIRLIPL